jgi:hypothetical protein
MSSCWDCSLQKIGGDTFLGLCKRFEADGKEAKEIKPARVDVGCKFFEAKEESR